MNDTDIERALGTTEPRVNADDALARFQARVQSEGIAPVIPVARPRVTSRWLQGLAAAAGVVIVASALTLSGVAESVLKIFEPKSVVAVPLSQGDLSYLSQACSGLNLQECMGAYGTFVWTVPPQPKEVSSRSQASAQAGFTVLAPGSLPASVTGDPRYGVINRSTATFTFSADSTQQTAARQNRPRQQGTPALRCAACAPGRGGRDRGVGSAPFDSGAARSTGLRARAVGP